MNKKFRKSNLLAFRIPDEMFAELEQYADGTIVKNVQHVLRIMLDDAIKNKRFDKIISEHPIMKVLKNERSK